MELMESAARRRGMMHELSIAVNLVELAEAAAREAGATHVDVVFLQVGALSGVVADALQFGYGVATRGTLLEGSRLEIEEMPVRVYCPDCDRESSLPSPQSLCCPLCGRPTFDLRGGHELELRSMEVCVDETAPA